MKRLLLVALGLGALVVLPIGQGNYIILILSSWLMFSIAAMGLNLTLGYAGQISLAQASFMAMGAYITALMTLAGVPWILAAVAAVAACFVIGLLVGFLYFVHRDRRRGICHVPRAAPCYNKFFTC